jgi:hypothetical protein
MLVRQSALHRLSRTNPVLFLSICSIFGPEIQTQFPNNITSPEASVPGLQSGDIGSRTLEMLDYGDYTHWNRRLA